MFHSLCTTFTIFIHLRYVNIYKLEIYSRVKKKPIDFRVIKEDQMADAMKDVEHNGPILRH